MILGVRSLRARLGSGLVILALAGCGGRPYTVVGLQSMELGSPKMKPAAAFKKMTQIFVDRGFDIKMSNADAGVVTTEYKKFASSRASTGSSPPFDYFLQIRAAVKDKTQKTTVQLTPAVKEVNRSNSAAFTEHELCWLEGDRASIDHISTMRPNEGWQWLGQAMFMNVVSDTENAFGLTIEEVVKNETRTPRDFGTDLAETILTGTTNPCK